MEAGVRRFGLRMILVGAVLVTVVAAVIRCAGREARLAHEEMLLLRSSIHEGMTADEIEGVFKKLAPRYLRYVGADGPVVITVQSVPAGVPAKEWVLWVSLRQGRAAALRIRTEDSSRERPRGAQEDLIWQEEDQGTPFMRQAQR